MTKLKRLERVLNRASKRRYEVVGRRAEREKLIKEKGAELHRVKRQLVAKALVPGGQDTEKVDELEARVRELASELQQIEGEEAEAAEAVREAKEAREEEAFRLAPEVVARVELAMEKLKGTWAELGIEAARHVKKALDADTDLRGATVELQGLTAELKRAGRDRAEQVRELRSHLRNQEPLSDEVILGFLVVQATAISRREGGLPELWSQLGVSTLPTSVLEGSLDLDLYSLFHLRQLPKVNL